MKTEYMVKVPEGNLITEWTSDVQHLRENFRTAGATLWRHQSETAEEAAVRRMNFIEHSAAETIPQPNGDRIARIPCGSTVSAEIDRLCPPPATTEVQVDWDTLEPVRDVPAWDFLGVWVAGIEKESFDKKDDTDLVNLLLGTMKEVFPNAAIGPTRETALRNLAEFQAAKKGAAK